MVTKKTAILAVLSILSGIAALSFLYVQRISLDMASRDWETYTQTRARENPTDRQIYPPREWYLFRIGFYLARAENCLCYSLFSAVTSFITGTGSIVYHFRDRLQRAFSQRDKSFDDKITELIRGWRKRIIMKKQKILRLSQLRFSGRMSVEEALKLRRTVRRFSGKEIDFSVVSQLLWALQGSKRAREFCI